MSRTDFNETWLTEMPAKLGNFGNTFDILEKSIREWIEDGRKPEKLSNILYRLDGQNMMYYWYQDGDNIVVAVELDKKPQGMVVSIVGKNPEYSGKPPYSTDLYSDILPTIPYSMLFSDNQLSDDGIQLWKKLSFDSSNTISVFNSKDPGKTFKTLNTPDELDSYLGDDKYYDRFVLSKKGHTLSETRSYFSTRRLREMAGMNLND